MPIGTWHSTLGELDAVLPGVLAELKVIDRARRPFVVVSEPVTQRFVQFARVLRTSRRSTSTCAVSATTQPRVCA